MVEGLRRRQLNDLEHRKPLDANQNLKAAAARVKEARAINQTARAGLFPTVDAGFGPTREKRLAGVTVRAATAETYSPAQTLWRAEASASYEVDLFGRVSDSIVKARKPPTPSEERGAVPLGAACVAGGRRAELFQPARARFGKRCLYAQAVQLREQALKLVQKRRFDEGEISQSWMLSPRAQVGTCDSTPSPDAMRRCSACALRPSTASRCCSVSRRRSSRWRPTR